MVQKDLNSYSPERIATPVGLIDVMPTGLELAGVSAPAFEGERDLSVSRGVARVNVRWRGDSPYTSSLLC